MTNAQCCLLREVYRSICTQAQNMPRRPVERMQPERQNLLLLIICFIIYFCLNSAVSCRLKCKCPCTIPVVSQCCCNQPDPQIFHQSTPEATLLCLIFMHITATRTSGEPQNASKPIQASECCTDALYLPVVASSPC